ncbi:DUF2267 domain-containing protein [Streptomyces purpureus]|uniref:DUF2267 domain-containing protein n=1 Tax=Streptomyces purpureus TaxID=1951 RepID=UPI0037A04E70
MTYEQMLETVRHEGAYPTRERAAEAVHEVMSALGRQLTGWGFVKDLAGRVGGSPATARWDAGSVLSTVARLAGPQLLDRVLARLPEGYALLFGRAELRQSRSAA